MMYKRDYYERFDMVKEYSKLVKRSKVEKMNEKIEQLIKEIAQLQIEISELKND